MRAADPAWLDLVVEEIVDPELPIVDPHHHLWAEPHRLAYELDDLRADTGSGHNVVATVFVECHSAYRDHGPEHLRCVGETEYVTGRAVALEHETPAAAPIAGIVAHADLRDLDRLDEVLDAHDAAAAGRFRGIRQSASYEPAPAGLMNPGRGPERLYADPDYRAGARRLGERGLTLDAWHHHHQIRDFIDLAHAAPQTVMVHDHFGGPMGAGIYAGRADEIFATWRDDIVELARCENVVAKLGGLAMPDNGFGWDTAARPATSDEVVAAQARWYEHTIDCFGPDRCMFESNFPVDRMSLSYAVFWNAAKKLSAGYTAAERAAMFSGTATRVYRL